MNEWERHEHIRGAAHQRKLDAERHERVEDARIARSRVMRRVTTVAQANARAAPAIGFRVQKKGHWRVPFDTPLGGKFVALSPGSVIMGEIEEGYEIGLIVWGHVALVLVVLSILTIPFHANPIPALHQWSFF